MVGITAGSREVPGRNACDRRHTYRIIIIIIIIIITIITIRIRKAEGGILEEIETSFEYGIKCKE